MSAVEIFYCNKTYNYRWLKDKKSSNGIQYRIIHAIIEVVRDNEGGSITQKEIQEYAPEISDYLERRNFRIVPNAGTEMSRNGKNIHHAKYSPTKSVAVLWAVIKDKIYVTFDDHQPIKYHRAIYSFHQLRLGKPVYPLKSRCHKNLRKILRSKRPWKYKGIDPRDRFYYLK